MTGRHCEPLTERGPGDDKAQGSSLAGGGDGAGVRVVIGHISGRFGIPSGVRVLSCRGGEDMTRIRGADIDHGTTAALRVGLLGGFRVERAGVTIPAFAWQRRGAKNLTKLLATA